MALSPAREVAHGVVFKKNSSTGKAELCQTGSKNLSLPQGRKLISSTWRQHSTPSYDSSTIVFLVSNPTFPLPCAHHGVFYIIVYGVARGFDYYTHGV
jgi:hypothetical protein